MTPEQVARITIERLPGRGDRRGEAFDVSRSALEFVGGISDMHLVTMLPGAIRGNHRHPETHELLVVFHRDSWVLVWQEDALGEIQNLEFSGTGAVAVSLMPGVAHALENTGAAEMVLASLLDWKGEQGKAVAERVVLRG